MGKRHVSIPVIRKSDLDFSANHNLGERGPGAIHNVSSWRHPGCSPRVEVLSRSSLLLPRIGSHRLTVGWAFGTIFRWKLGDGHNAFPVLGCRSTGMTGFRTRLNAIPGDQNHPSNLQEVAVETHNAILPFSSLRPVTNCHFFAETQLA